VAATAVAACPQPWSVHIAVRSAAVAWVVSSAVAQWSATPPMCTLDTVGVVAPVDPQNAAIRQLPTVVLAPNVAVIVAVVAVPSELLAC